MIFMSQSGLLDRSREADWDAWYLEHLRIMRTVKGIHSAWRFKSESLEYPPSLAMYSVDSPAVFDDPYYQKIRGMGEWLPLIDRRFYHRNLFEGLTAAPDVPADHVLLLADRDAPELLPGNDFVWLKCVGLDQSTACRGIAVMQPEPAAALAKQMGVAVYGPVGR